MKSLCCLLAALGILLVPDLTQAEEGSDRRWSDEAELSYVKNSGNSQLETLVAKNLFRYRHDERWRSSVKLTALNGKSDGTRTSESYAAELRTDFAITERLYALAIAGWLKDNYAGIDASYSLGPGLGYKVLTGPQHFLNTEAGINYVQEDYTDGTDNDFYRGRLYALYEFHLAEKNKFSQSLEYLYDFEDSENYNVVSETALTSALTSFWSLKASYTIKYDNQPVPASLKDKETLLAVGLVLNI